MVNFGGPGDSSCPCWQLWRPRRRAWPPLVTADACAAAETAGCRLGRRRSRRRAPNSAAPASSSPLIDRQFEVSALSGGSVGRLCGSGGRVWSGDRSPSLVCVFSGRLCVLGLWILFGLETGLFVSRGLFVSVCPPGTSARFCNVPGAGAFGGFDSPAGLRLRLLLLLARDVQSAVPSLRSSVVYAPYRRRSECAVRCFRCL